MWISAITLLFFLLCSLEESSCMNVCMHTYTNVWNYYYIHFTAHVCIVQHLLLSSRNTIKVALLCLKYKKKIIKQHVDFFVPITLYEPTLLWFRKKDFKITQGCWAVYKSLVLVSKWKSSRTLWKCKVKGKVKLN